MSSSDFFKKLQPLFESKETPKQEKPKAAEPVLEGEAAMAKKYAEFLREYDEFDGDDIDLEPGSDGHSGAKPNKEKLSELSPLLKKRVSDKRINRFEKASADWEEHNDNTDLHAVGDEENPFEPAVEKTFNLLQRNHRLTRPKHKD